MLKQEEVKGWLKGHEGQMGVIPIRYFWVTQNKWGPIMIDWEQIPKQQHGQFLRNLHAPDALGTPQAVYVVMEVRSLPMHLKGEEQKKLQEELQAYKMKTGSFEGFPGIKDYAMYIGYDGENYKTEMFELTIDEDDVRTFGEPHSLDGVMGGIYADNLFQAFHNVGHSQEA